MKTILALVLLAATAHADKPIKVGCEVKGDPIFEIDHLDTQAPKQVLAVKLYATGAWSFSETTAEGKPGRTEAGCINADALKRFRTELAAAKWQVKTARIHCMAISPNFTRYLANGKQVFEEHTCGGQSLDEASEKAKLDADSLLAPAFSTKP